MSKVCPECKRLEKKSQLVEIVGGYSKKSETNAYIDEDGVYHWHDYNFTFRIYRCSNGHDILDKSFNGCSICGFSGGINEFKLCEFEI